MAIISHISHIRCNLVWLYRTLCGGLLFLGCYSSDYDPITVRSMFCFTSTDTIRTIRDGEPSSVDKSTVGTANNHIHTPVCVITGFQARARGGRWSWTLSPEEIVSREAELGCESWTSFASGWSSTAVQRTLSLWLCPARQLKQQLPGALVAGQWRGDTALTLPLFWRRSTVSPVFFGRYPRSSLHSFVPTPTPTPSPSLISHLASVDVKQNGLS